LMTLIVWEKRWRELLRWELYLGLILQAAMIGGWVWFVYAGPDGPAHLKVFFWNNLVGRFTHVDAPQDLQYAAAHRNSPGKYLIELPLYLCPWTLLVMAALRRAWSKRKVSFDAYRPVRFALAASLPPLALLSLAATARNVYLAPALPGIALLLAWWAAVCLEQPDRWDIRAMRATAVLLLAGVAAVAAAACFVGADAWVSMTSHAAFIAISVAGLIAATFFALRAWSVARDQVRRALPSLLLAYCALLVGPASQIYREVDAWQDLGSIARAIGHDSADKPLILFAPDETTRAMIDMYARTNVALIPGPIEPAALDSLRAETLAVPQSLVVVQLPHPALTMAAAFGAARRSDNKPELPWAEAAGLRVAKSYALPNGRRYALLAPIPTSSR
jgi:4-amino-4-deoxy-L-arabinose transferase-like glycosyltransferase